MNEEPPKDLATRAFQKRVLDEFAAMRGEIAGLRGEVGEIRAEQSAMRNDITDIRTETVEIRTQQTAMAMTIGSLDHRLTSLEERVDARLKETRPIWEAVQEQLQRLVEKFDTVLLDSFDLRNELKIHGRRIAHLEERLPG
jgi:predicted  nucleic acid-binding Zn-ribbon protein